MNTKNIDLQKVVWEGWTVGDFIDSLMPLITVIMSGQSWVKPFTTKQDLAAWCRANQPYYKKEVRGVADYFAQMYHLH